MSLADYPIPTGDTGATLISDGATILSCGGVVGSFVVVQTVHKRCYALDATDLESGWKIRSDMPESVVLHGLVTLTDDRGREVKFVKRVKFYVRKLR